MNVHVKLYITLETSHLDSPDAPMALENVVTFLDAFLRNVSDTFDANFAGNHSFNR